MLGPFEEIGQHLYVPHCMDPAWEQNQGYDKDKWRSLRLFLQGYAFERQGASPDYAFAAVDAIDKATRDNPSVPLDSTSASRVWDSFAESLREKGLNHANNPLCPRGNYERTGQDGKAKTFCVKKLSAVELASQLGGPLIQWAKGALERGGVREAHDQLSQVNGVSNKIASFFLRDVASRFQAAPADGRVLLQPIDTWIRFVVREHNGNENMQDPECAKWIVDNSPRPEAANQGIWYFCAKIAHKSQYLVKRALQDPNRPNYLNALINQYLGDLRHAAGVAKAFDRG